MIRLRRPLVLAPALAVLSVVAASCGGASGKQFPCGSSTCDAATEYCDHVLVDTGGTPDQFLCEPVPSDQCQGTAPSCACLTVFRCQCSEANGGVTIDRGGGAC